MEADCTAVTIKAYTVCFLNKHGGIIMHLGSVYLIANDFEKSIAFYEKLLEIPLTSENNGRFASFEFEGHRISIMNGHFDMEHPDKVVRKGSTTHIGTRITLEPAVTLYRASGFIEILRNGLYVEMEKKLGDDIE